MFEGNLNGVPQFRSGTGYFFHGFGQGLGLGDLGLRLFLPSPSPTIVLPATLLPPFAAAKRGSNDLFAHSTATQSSHKGNAASLPPSFLFIQRHWLECGGGTAILHLGLPSNLLFLSLATLTIHNMGPPHKWPHPRHPQP